MFEEYIVGYYVATGSNIYSVDGRDFRNSVGIQDRRTIEHHEIQQNKKNGRKH